MSARRGRKVRFPSPEELPAPPDPVAEIGPIAFSARFDDGIERHYDLSHLPCPRLVRHLAKALAGIAGSEGKQGHFMTTAHSVRYIERFAAFIVRVEENAESFDLEDVTPELMEAFERKLIADHPEKSRVPYQTVVGIMQLLRLLRDDHPDAFDADMQARMGFSTLKASHETRPVDAYPFDVFEAMEAAALDDVRAIRDRLLEGERLAEQGEDPAVAGWDRVENALWYIARHGPLTSDDLELPGMHRRLKVLGGMKWLNSRLFLTMPDLVSFLVLLTCQTGIEPECGRRLTADCLVNPARGYVSISYVKKRSHGWSHRSIRVSDGGALHHPAGLLRLAIRLTARGRQVTGSDLIWNHAVNDGVKVTFGPGSKAAMANPMEVWAARHRIDRLKDKDGTPVRLYFKRLRKTYKSRRYLESAGLLDDFAQGHSKRVAVRHYADIEAHRELHEDAVENGLLEALQTALEPPTVLSEDGQRLDDGEDELTPSEVTQALSGENDVWLASCKDFFNSPTALKKGSACPTAVWGCLECPNAVYTTRHLPSLLSFTAFVDRQRDEMSGAEWKARYGLAWERLSSGVLPKFTAEQRATARAIAESAEGPHALPVRLLEATI
ncbi:hypothetical protein ABT404_13010 [Streptomyces hyaluromycini]|uniref:Integrase n=1 Tax=Streptomyces hyaluromycini TaxID=1377993 RepID=A0ABV1WUD2_9ACTN